MRSRVAVHVPKSHSPGLRNLGGLALHLRLWTSDEWDVMAWEQLALTLASRAGIQTPRTELMSVAGRNVLLLNRFDRVRDLRIGYVSAMTMLEAVDDEHRSYLEIAEVIEQSS